MFAKIRLYSIRLQDWNIQHKEDLDTTLEYVPEFSPLRQQNIPPNMNDENVFGENTPTPPLLQDTSKRSNFKFRRSKDVCFTKTLRIRSIRAYISRTRSKYIIKLCVLYICKLSKSSNADKQGDFLCFTDSTTSFVSRTERLSLFYGEPFSETRISQTDGQRSTSEIDKITEERVII